MTIFSDPNIQHGPIEGVITAQEENGIVGIQNFDCSLIKSKYFISIDSEADNSIIIGCAGGYIFNGIRRIKREKTLDKSLKNYEITINNV